MTSLNSTPLRYRAFIMIVMTLFAIAGCERKEFVLPPGDKAAGKQEFLELKCNSCHSVTDQVEHAPLTPGAIHVELGGTVSRVKTYDDLITSIINPSHRLSRGTNLMTTTPEGQSRMPVYNEIMSVQQLIDITSFLEPTYQVWVPPYAVYQYP
ncbi:MAG: c-type cytochrome [Pseudomonadaceae bacterium]|nr:c-type cytochrome [Pseudomonadaceae bacterium]